jgi:hypothetical protein
VELPYGKERILITDKSDFDFKELLEMMTVSPERKIIIDSETAKEIITISDIFNILNL